MMILHLHPVNASTQLMGFGLVVYGIWLHSAGIWLHSAVYTMTGVSLVLIGHLWGWSKVSNAL